MPGLFERWMTAKALEESARISPHLRQSTEGGEYARELREVARRLRHESEMDLEFPTRELRYRTLDALHESYMLQPRLAFFNISPRPSLLGSWTWRGATRLAACLVLLLGGAWALTAHGPALVDSTRDHLASLRARSADRTGPPIAPEPNLAGAPSPNLGGLPIYFYEGGLPRFDVTAMDLAADQPAGTLNPGAAPGDLPRVNLPRDAQAGRDHSP